MRKPSIKWERAFKVVGFLLIAAMLMTALCFFMKPKNEMDYADQRSYEAYRVFDEPENTIDVVMLGHSGVYRGISPMEMYREYGFTSYACSRLMQLPWESYEFLEQVLEKQSPKLVMFETDQLFFNDEKSLEMTIKRFQPDRYISVLRNHAVWKDALPSTTKRERSATKGYQYINSVRPPDHVRKWEETDKVYQIRKDRLNILDKLYALCEERGMQLVMVEAPSTVYWDCSKYNAVKAYAESKGIEFLDANQKLDEMGLSWAWDTYDGGDHLNYSGAKKFSKYIGKYLKETFSLPDRRGDENYAFWEEDYASYLKITGEANE